MRFLYRYQLVLFILGMESFRQKNKHSNILIMKKMCSFIILTTIRKANK